MDALAVRAAIVAAVILAGITGGSAIASEVDTSAALTAKDAISNVPLVPADVTVSTDRPHQWDVNVTDPGVDSGTTHGAVHTWLQFGSGDTEVVASVNGQPYLMLMVRSGPAGRVVRSVGVIAQHDETALPADGLVYFPNYIAQTVLKSGKNTFDIAVRPISDAPPGSVVLRRSSFLELTPSDFQELTIAAPNGIAAQEGEKFSYEVVVKQRGTRAPVEQVAPSASHQGALREVRLEPISVSSSGLGRYRVTGVADGPGSVLVSFGGGYNKPSDVTVVGLAVGHVDRSAIIVGLLALPIALALLLSLRNRLRGGRHEAAPSSDNAAAADEQSRFARVP